MCALPEQKNEDAEVMARLRAGDASALAILYERYLPLVRGLAAMYVNGCDRANLLDVVQDVFMTLLETAGRYREEGRLRSWIAGITVRKARGMARRRRIRDALLLRYGQDAAPAASLSGVGASTGISAEMQGVLDKLPPAQRDVLVMHVVHELSGDEIASALGIKVNAVWTRLHRARHAMRQALEAQHAGAQP